VKPQGNFADGSSVFLQKITHLPQWIVSTSIAAMTASISSYHSSKAIGLAISKAHHRLSWFKKVHN
jgi:hypothetical protein